MLSSNPLVFLRMQDPMGIQQCLHLIPFFVDPRAPVGPGFPKANVTPNSKESGHVYSRKVREAAF
jgi:hypothetical protein